jgi:hypothetical protein
MFALFAVVVLQAEKVTSEVEFVYRVSYFTTINVDYYTVIDLLHRKGTRMKETSR